MLNPSQQSVVDFRDGAALVVAGAGTGKTRVLVHRAAALIRAGAAPNRLLMLTFTRRSAEELKHRVAELTGIGTFPWCGTFHSVGAKLLRIYGGNIQIPSPFSILDQSDSTDLFNLLLRENFTKEQRREMPSKSVLAAISSYQTNTCQPLLKVLEQRWSQWAHLEDIIAELVEAYRERKRAAHSLDYDDLLVKWHELWTQSPRAAPRLFDYIMVDEYQDTNRLQAKLLESLKRDTENMLVVGDDAQAIYGFRGATVRNILEFGDMFESVKPFRLEHNYRSTAEILDISNALMEDAAEGFEKHLESHRGAGVKPQLLPCADDWQEADAVLHAIEQLQSSEGIPLAEQAVLMRSSYHSFRLEIGLTRHNIAYRKVGGLRFADSAHIKDAMAYLRCAENPRDESAWQRVLGHLPGIGPVTATKRFRELMGAPSVAEGMRSLKFPAKTDPDLVDRFQTLFAVLLAPDPGPPAEQMRRVNQFYVDRMPDFFDNWEERKRDLPMVEEMAARYDKRGDFLDDIVVGDDSVVRSRQHQDDRNKLTLSTIHSAKGCEWQAVHIVHAIEGGLPVLKEDAGVERIEEERRLFYVAMTRAKDHLRIYAPMSRMSRGANPVPQHCRLSRFLTPRVLCHCEGCEDLTASEHSEEIPPPTLPEELVYDYSDCN
ncbi:MAG: ATP-dependent helicase [Verrucomicrobiota bacterium]